MEIFQKIVSLIMSILMALGIITVPSVDPADAYTQAEWYALVADTFNLDYDAVEGEELDEEAQVLAAIKKWNVLVGEYDADAAITDVLVAKSLVAAANLESEDEDADEVTIAIESNIVSVNIVFGEPQENIISKEDANTALTVAHKLWLDSKRTVENGGTVSTTDQGTVDMNSLDLVLNGGEYSLQTADGAIIEDEDIVALDYEGNVNPFAAPETAGIGEQSIIEDIEVDFSIGDMDVYAGLKDGGFDVGLSGTVNGVFIEKYYEVRDFNVATKFDGALSVNDIKHSYVLVDYTLTDRTTITGSKAWSLDETELPEGSDEVDFLARVQNNLFEMREGADSEITVFNVDVAIPNCPAITVGITAKLVVTFDGRVDLVIVSNETKGVEIIDNKVRAVSESECDSWNLTAQARVEALLGLYVDISIVSICLVDVGIEVGLGVHVTVYMEGGISQYTLDIPYDFLMDIHFNIPNAENLSVSTNIKLYGIVTISVGENSDILEPLGLCETWHLVTEENGTFYDSGLVVLMQDGVVAL